MKRAKVTLGNRQAALLYAAASRGIDEFDADDNDETGSNQRLAEEMQEALTILVRAMYAAGFDHEGKAL